MSFTGADYHRVFEEACRELPWERSEEAVRGKLLTVEWIMWEALRDVFSRVSMIIGALIVLPFASLISPGEDRAWLALLVIFGAFVALATLLYWICRGVFHFEFARKIRGRKFGTF